MKISTRPASRPRDPHTQSQNRHLRLRSVMAPCYYATAACILWRMPEPVSEVRQDTPEYATILGDRLREIERQLSQVLAFQARLEPYLPLLARVAAPFGWRKSHG